MSVLVQTLLSPELSFVLHTAHPLSRDPDLLVAEIAVGLGETLASGVRGTPWRLQVNKKTGEVQTLALNNMSEAMVVDPNGAADGKMIKIKVDYSQQVNIHRVVTNNDRGVTNNDRVMMSKSHMGVTGC
jgi:phosphoglucan,water dikinase